MLSFSRKAEKSFSQTDVATLMDQALEMLSRDYSLHGLGNTNSILRKHYHPNTPEVICSQSEVRQAFFNIVKNAAQALSENEAQGDEPPYIRIRIKPGPLGVRIEIEDNGPGMSEGVLRRAFEPFFTARDTGSGVGLGLSVCYFIIVEQHQGRLRILSRPGEGSRVLIDLPAHGHPSDFSASP